MQFMIIFIICIFSFSTICATHQFIKLEKFYEKLTAFFYICINLTMIILLSFLDNLHFIMDAIIILLLLELVIILTFLSNKSKIKND